MSEERKSTGPNLARPRLPDEDEERLFPLDELARKAYTVWEAGAAKLRELLGGQVAEELEAGDSVMVHIEPPPLPTQPKAK